MAVELSLRVLTADLGCGGGPKGSPAFLGGALAGRTEPMVDAAQLETQCAEMPSFPPPRTFTGRGYHPEAITPERKRWHPTNGAHLPAFGLVSAGTREQQVGRRYHTFDPRQPFRTARWEYSQRSMN